jgi:hypothetical protein
VLGRAPGKKGRKAKASSTGERAVGVEGVGREQAATWPRGSESSIAPPLPSGHLSLSEQKQS